MRRKLLIILFSLFLSVPAFADNGLYFGNLLSPNKAYVYSGTSGEYNGSYIAPDADPISPFGGMLDFCVATTPTAVGSESYICAVYLHSNGSVNIAGPVQAPDNVILSSAGYPTTIVSTYNKVAYYLNQGNSGPNSIYTLPIAALGLRYCVRNYTGDTQVLTFQSSASGQYIDVAGTNTASGGYVTTAGAAGDEMCVRGVDATHWVLNCIHGTCTGH